MVCALLSVVLVITPIVICNIVVVTVAKDKCYSDADKIPHSGYGILLGTGRSSAPSPYYDARIQATIDLLKAHKIDVLIISGENQYPDYHEVDSMAADILYAIPNACIYRDYEGTDTYSSLVNAAQKFGKEEKYIIISQDFHNQRAIYLASKLLSPNTVAYNAPDTSKIYWLARNFFRECLARTKAVLVRCF